MTNFEYLKNFEDASSFWETIETFICEPMYKYVDMAAFLNSDSNEPLDYLRTIGKCFVLMTSAGVDESWSEEQRREHILQHGVEMPILQRNIQRFRSTYVMVADKATRRALMVPETAVVFTEE